MIEYSRLLLWTAFAGTYPCTLIYAQSDARSATSLYDNDLGGTVAGVR